MGSTTKRSIVLTSALVVLCGLSVGGCSGGKRVTAGSTRWDPSPELDTLDRSYDQVLNDMARTNSTNIRGAQDDGLRMLMLDEPVRMNQMPIP
ncbi:MAG: hypothetical protein IT441_10865 [Phycisphaeraceae bacterium]|nr:hypothetical protein [Phycisphaeraceae bacterium]